MEKCLAKSKIYYLLFYFLILLGMFTQSIAADKPSKPPITGRYVIADIVEDISPAVVNINSIINPDNLSESGGASGFLVSKEGYILTNHHVIKNAKKIRVIFHNGHIIKDVKIIGSDSLTDIAVLQIPANRIPEEISVIKPGNSDKIRVGEWVIAIGNPFSYHLGNKPTVTAGIISTINRNIETQQRTYKDFIQTDAPINPGNSGGPLVNLEGKVIGINTAIIPYARGIGFAIPINKATQIMNELINTGHVNRPWLGIKVKEASLITEESGALISEIVPNSPADKSNLKKNDIIIKINQYQIQNVKDFEERKQKLEIGEKVKIVILRKGIKHYILIDVIQNPNP